MVSPANSRDALNRQVTYSEIDPEEWEQKLKNQGIPEHLKEHLLAMGELHRAGRYDRRADGVQQVTGRPPMSAGNSCCVTQRSSADVAPRRRPDAAFREPVLH
jgi:hypothetical protein